MRPAKLAAGEGRLSRRLPLHDSHDGSVRDAAVADVQLSERARRALSEVLDASVAHPETQRDVTPLPPPLPQEGVQKDTNLVQSETFRCLRYFSVAKDLKLASVNLGHSAAWSQRRPCELLHSACQLASVSWLLPEAGGVNWREALLVLRDRRRVGKSHPRV